MVQVERSSEREALFNWGSRDEIAEVALGLSLVTGFDALLQIDTRVIP